MKSIADCGFRFWVLTKRPLIWHVHPTFIEAIKEAALVATENRAFHVQIQRYEITIDL